MIDSRRPAPRGRRSRRGFTLLELLMASTCTVGIVTAGTTMALAVSYALSAVPANSTAVVTGHGAVQRLGKLVRAARLVGYHDATNITLWSADANKDDQVQFSETALAWYDAASKELRWTVPFPSSMSAASVAAADRVVSFAEFADSAYPTTIQAAANAATTVLAENALGFQIKGNAAATDAKVLDLRLKLRTDQEPLSFVTSVSPRAPADYLTSTTLRTNDGVATKRYRRVNQRSWTVPP